jgi:uncharacterized membrane protein
MGAFVILHLLAAIVWVGGMFFAVYIMRLAAGPMEPADRVRLWGRAFPKFFPWVWISVVILPATGYYMVFGVYAGFADLPFTLHIMHGLGWVMILIFLHLWFAPYARFRRALAADDIPEAGKQLNAIRILVTTNLWIGLINSGFGVAGRYWG